MIISGLIYGRNCCLRLKQLELVVVVVVVVELGYVIQFRLVPVVS